MHDRGAALIGRRLLLLWIGFLMAIPAWFLAYDVDGREPPCFEAESELRQSHPDAVEFRNAGGGFELTQSCEAVAANGTVIGRVTYPRTAGWVFVGVVLCAPLAGDTALRGYRRRHPVETKWTMRLTKDPPWPPEAPAGRRDTTDNG
jgi:hypothetical protein